MSIRNKFSLIRSFVREIFNLLITYAPGILGHRLRYRYYKRKLKYLGKGAVIDFGVYIIKPHLISIGDNTHIDRWVTLAAGKAVEGRHNDWAWLMRVHICVFHILSLGIKLSWPDTAERNNINE